MKKCIVCSDWHIDIRGSSSFIAEESRWRHTDDSIIRAVESCDATEDCGIGAKLCAPPAIAQDRRELRSERISIFATKQPANPRPNAQGIEVVTRHQLSAVRQGSS